MGSEAKKKKRSVVAEVEAEWNFIFFASEWNVRSGWRDDDDDDGAGGETLFVR